MMNDKPAMAGQDGGRAAADLEHFPGEYRACQPMMGIEQARRVRLEVIKRHRAVGNPDTLVFQIDPPALAHTGIVLGQGAREKRAMEHGQLELPCMVRNSDGENAGVLVVDVHEIDSPIRLERRQADPSPVKQGPPKSPGQSLVRSMTHAV